MFSLVAKRFALFLSLDDEKGWYGTRFKLSSRLPSSLFDNYVSFSSNNIVAY